MDLVQKGQSARGNTAQNIRRERDVFNKYVRPESEMEWDRNPTVKTHSLSSTDPHITNADPISIVWSHFCLCLGNNIAPDKAVILVAWNGDGCNLKWLWKLTQVPGLQLE